MPSTDDLERRLAHLERMQRSCQALLVALLVASVIALWIVYPRVRRPAGGGVASEDVVEARQLRLLDARGRVRARLAVTEEGQAGLLVLDESGKLRTALTADRHGLPRLQFFADRGAVLGVMGCDTDRSISLILKDPAGKLRAGLSVLPDQVALLQLFGSDEKPRALMGVRAEGTASVKILDASGSESWQAP